MGNWEQGLAALDEARRLVTDEDKALVGEALDLSRLTLATFRAGDEVRDSVSGLRGEVLGARVEDVYTPAP